MKTYSEIRCKNKDVKYIIRGTHSTLHCRFAFNSISGTFYGLLIESFIESVRGFLREFPKFFEEAEGVEIKKWLSANNFVQVEPSETEKMVYENNLS